MSHIIIGTAGHIDHGKTALVRALTGVNTDRLKEEKERGLTIDLGFARWGEKATIIDVPGHERFIRNMVAGVSAIDLVLLVIAADDGVMPQTREHLDILKILQVQRGLVVVTKIDLVEPEWLSLVMEEIKTLVAGSFLEGSDVVPVSSVTKKGIAELSARIDGLARQVRRSRDTGVFWMPVDRSFSMKGFGTVLTGSILSGSIATGDSIEILPQKIATKVRGLQSGGRAAGQLRAGDRAAINLQAVDKRSVGRGSVVTLPERFKPSRRFDARLQLLESAPRPLKQRSRVRVHCGTAEVMARVAILGQRQIEPGGIAYAQLHLEETAAARRLDPFVIRQYSPTLTIGGGVILNADAPRRKLADPAALAALEALERRDPAEALESILLTAGFQTVAVARLATELAADSAVVKELLAKLAAEDRLLLLGKGSKQTAAHRLKLEELSRLTLNALADFHRDNPTKPGVRKAELESMLNARFDSALMDAALRRLKESGRVKENAGLISLSAHEITLPPALNILREKIRRLLYESVYATPSSKEIAQTLGVKEAEVAEALAAMIGLNEVVRTEESVLFDSRRVAEAEAELVEFLQAHEEITISQFKELLGGVSRKFAMPLINHFDRTGVTRREGDVRILA